MSKEYNWATGPLKLIPTPSYLQRGTEHDRFTAAATMMAQVHNAFIRGLNGMWHLSPKVPPSDLSNFVGFCHAIAQGLDFHHDEEEMAVFPAVEEVMGVKGLMAESVKQHEAFHAGIIAFGDYLTHLLATDPTNLSTKKFPTLFTAFAEPLQIHLEAEIQSILDLWKYAHTGVDLMQLADEAAKNQSPQESW